MKKIHFKTFKFKSYELIWFIEFSFYCKRLLFLDSNNWAIYWRCTCCGNLQSSRLASFINSSMWRFEDFVIPCLSLDTVSCNKADCTENRMFLFSKYSSIHKQALWSVWEKTCIVKVKVPRWAHILIKADSKSYHWPSTLLTKHH